MAQKETKDINDTEKAQKGTETLVNFLAQLGDANYYTSMIWEEFFKEVYGEESERGDTSSLPVSSEERQEGNQNNQHSQSNKKYPRHPLEGFKNT